MAVQSSQQLSMDTATQGGFIKFFNFLGEKPTTTIRIFDRNSPNMTGLLAIFLYGRKGSGLTSIHNFSCNDSCGRPNLCVPSTSSHHCMAVKDYYTVHGEDATYAANEVFHTNSVIKLIGSGNSKLSSVILSKPNFESFVRDLLLVKQYRVEIYCCKSKTSNDWKLTYKASPGNLQQLEDVLFGSLDMASSLTIMAVKLTTENGQRVLGIAYAELSSERLGVAEFIENDQFSNLEAVVVQLCPKECLVVAHDSSSDSRKLIQTLEKSGVLVSERKRTEFLNNDIVQDLDRLLTLQPGVGAASLSQVDLNRAMCSLAALIKYLELLSDESNFGVYSLSTFDFSQYLCLDSAAVRALNLEPQPGDSHTSHLLGILNHCRSPQGQRLLMHWLRQPLLDKNKIEERLDVVEILSSDLAMRRSLQDCLKIIPDYFRLAKKLNKGKGSLQDVVRVYQSVCKLPIIINSLSTYDGTKSNLLKDLLITPLKELREDFSKFTKMVEETVDMDLVNTHEYVIKSSFDKGLSDLRDQMNKIESKINVQLKKASKELGLEMHKAIKLEFTLQLGYCFRVTKKTEKCLRSHSHYRILETHKDGVRFNTSVVDGLNEEYLSLKREYSTTQASLVNDVLHIVVGYTEPMLTLNHILSQLDVMVSFGHASTIAPIPYVRPIITPRGEGDIILKGCRHPCMEMQDDVSFIANDVSLLRGRESFQIITGPNMGGKSTYMRQIGVAVLMAQAGCFVPCTSASICIVDSILARVGAGDSQLKGVSTFMAEMLETSSILKAATSDSLVIIDELGRGTSTYDGFGLAWAISRHIATEIKCFCLFATHFHELTLLANEVPTVRNLHVTALTSNEKLTLLYRVKPGVCDQSFGLHVAELAQFPAHVIEFAKKKVVELEIWNSHQLKASTETIDEPPQAKKKKLEKEENEEGEKIIENFLSSVRELASSGISDQEMTLKLEKLKLDFLSTDNAYVKSILVTLQHN